MIQYLFRTFLIISNENPFRSRNPASRRLRVSRSRAFIVFSLFSTTSFAVSISVSLAENLGKDFPNDLLADPLILEFQPDPAPAESPKPDPAPRPVTRKLQVIHIPEPRQVGKNSCDYRIIEFLINEALPRSPPCCEDDT